MFKMFVLVAAATRLWNENDVNIVLSDVSHFVPCHVKDIHPAIDQSGCIVLQNIYGCNPWVLE